MNKTLIITLVMLLSATQVFAQEGYYPRATSTPEGRPVRNQIMQNAANARREVRGMASSTRVEIKNMRDAFQQKMEQAKQAMEAERKTFKATMDAKKAEAKKIIDANRVKLQEKLKNIKDEAKKTAVQTVDKRFEEINASRLNHFSNVMDQLDKVLQNVGSRMAKVETAGKDVIAVKADITAAQAAIAAARAAIVAQSAKTYPLAINQEKTLRTDVGKTRQALGSDLKAVQDKVQAAHNAIKKAATDLAKIQGVDTVEMPASTATSTATSTGTSTNQ